MSDVVRLVAIRDTPLDIAEAYAAVSDGAAGGVALFVGAVRDNDGGQQVDGLDYTAHPSALTVLQQVADEIAAEHSSVAIAAIHRVGSLAVGDIAVVVAVSCPHRSEAFVACRALIDELKRRVPIWKHQVFSDGTEEWVGTP